MVRELAAPGGRAFFGASLTGAESEDGMPALEIKVVTPQDTAVVLMMSLSE
jgi:hypothetical protein